MKIGIDASRANKDKKTGVEWYSYHLIEELKKIDNQNQFFLYTNKPLKGDLAKCPENFHECVLKWPIPRSWTIGRLSLEMKFGKNKPDVLFVPAHTLPLINPKRSIVTIHDIGFEHFSEAYHWADKFYHKLIIKIIKKFATKILTVSDFTKKDLMVTYQIDQEKIKVIMNGYDANQYKILEKAEDELKAKYQINFPYILFIGRLELKKNIPKLVEAFGHFKRKNPNNKHKLVLVGTRGLTFPLVEAQIKKHALESDIIFPGWVEEEDLPKFLNSADLFVFPSLFEGFGIPVLEAMACGCPVACSNATSLPEVAGDSAYLFDPNSLDDTTLAMEKILFDANLKNELIKKGLEQVKNFSWQKCAEQTLKELLN